MAPGVHYFVAGWRKLGRQNVRVAGVYSHVQNHRDIDLHHEDRVVIRSSDVRQALIFGRDVDHLVAVSIRAEFFPLAHSADFHCRRSCGEGKAQFAERTAFVTCLLDEDRSHPRRAEMNAHLSRAVQRGTLKNVEDCASMASAQHHIVARHLAGIAVDVRVTRVHRQVNANREVHIENDVTVLVVQPAHMCHAMILGRNVF